MAYPVAVNAILELAFCATHNGQRVMNVFHYRFAGGATFADGAAALGAVVLAVQAPGRLYDVWIGSMSQDVTVDFIQAQWVSPTRYGKLRALAGVQVGQIGEDSYPQNVGAAITKVGELANRHSVGTVHMGGVPISYIDGGFISGPGIVQYSVLATEIKADLVLGTGQTLKPVIFNKANPPASVTVVDAFPQDTSRIDRRRTVGLGI